MRPMPIRGVVLALLLAGSLPVYADTFTLSSSGAANWSNIGTWIQNGLPATRTPGQLAGTIDTVNLSTSTFYTVTMDVTLAEAVTLTSACPDNTSTCVIDVIASGELRLTGASAIGADARLKISGGSVSNDGTLTIASTADLDWTSGTLRGSGTTTVASGGNVNATGASMTLDNHVLNLAGLFTYGAAASGFALDNGANLTIQTGGVFDIQNTGGIGSNLSGSPSINVQAAGTFKKTAAAGTASIGSLLNNAGTVSVTSGALRLSGGGFHSGTFNTAPGTTIIFDGGINGFLAGSSLTGSGTFALAAGTMDVDSAITVPVAAAFEQSGGTLTGSANFQIDGSLTWTGGRQDNSSGNGQTILNGSSNNVAPASSIQLAGRSMSATGTVTYNPFPAALSIDSGAVLTNSGTFNLIGDATIGSDGIGNPQFVNATGGQINKSLGAGTATFHPFFSNRQTLNVTSGTVTLAGGGQDLGTVNFASPANRVEINNGTFTITTSPVINGSGAIVVTGSSTTLTLSAPFTLDRLELLGGRIDGSGTLTVNNSLLWRDGAMHGPGVTAAANTATVDATSLTGPIALDSRTLENRGNFNWNGDVHALSIANGGALNNLGTFTATGGGTVLAPGGGAIDNSGTLEKTGGASSTRIDAFITNNGTFSSEVSGQALAINGGGTQTAGGTLSASAGAFVDFLGGTYSVPSGGSPLTGSGIFRVNGGTLALGGSLSLSSPAILQLQSGALDVAPSTAFQIFHEFHWTGGTLQGGGTARVFGGFIGDTAPTSLAGTTLAIPASFSYDAGSVNHLTLNGAANLNIEPGATFTMTSDGIIGGTAPAVVTVNGTLAKSGTGLARITVPVNLSGGEKTISIADGVLDLAGGGSTAGPIAVTAETSSLRISGGSFSIDAGASFTGSGTLHVAGGTLRVDTAITAEILEVSGGVLGGTAAMAANEAHGRAARSLDPPR